MDKGLANLPQASLRVFCYDQIDTFDHLASLAIVQPNTMVPDTTVRYNDTMVTHIHLAISTDSELRKINYSSRRSSYIEKKKMPQEH